MDKKNDLRRYGFDDNTPLSTRCDQFKSYLDEKFSNIEIGDITGTVKDAITEDMESIKEQITDTNSHIENAKNEIINAVDCNCNNNLCCTCHLATKEDINNTVDQINLHTDSKFDEINFTQEFTDLNKQIKEINNKLP